MAYYSKETMTVKDSVQAFHDFAVKAAEFAREMGEIEEHGSWVAFADAMYGFRWGALKIAKAKSMTQTETAQAIGLKLSGMS